VWLQSFASKANLTLPDLVTGGSWKKSPVTMTCRTGSARFLILLPTIDSLSKKSPSTIETMAL
ncbi:hypothetical protein BDZ89DRAFT_941735, partial [Hymenopellis radicata]